jgi:rod shape-determining protein MreC
VAEIVTPIDRVVLALGRGVANGWHDYVNLGGLRRENDALRAENSRLQIEQAQLSENARQAERLQHLLDFQPNFIGATLPAQVIATSGTEQSNLVYIDKGKRSGLKPDMAVIVPGGVVGKVREVFGSSAQVLLINDPSSGVGAILANSRLYGVVKGNARGGLLLDHIMTDEKVEAGEQVITSGGDRIFPKGLAIGVVEKVSQGRDLFWDVRVKPAVDLNRVEEVLIVTQMQSSQPESAEAPPVRASDILAQRLPGIAHRDAVPDANGRPSATSNKPAQSPNPAVAEAPKSTAAKSNSSQAVAAATPKPNVAAPKPKSAAPKTPVVPQTLPQTQPQVPPPNPEAQPQ